MKNHETTNHKDMQLLYNLEEVIISLDLSTQKAISLIRLGVNKDEAFSDAMKLMDEAKTIVSEIEDGFVLTMANEKVFEATANFESKMIQI
ncbi:hypothetical protein [Bacillus cereus]|uniref:hypothetical protein n=1 Tax=Bacillus cereus TaxID=1396 RepID=UPI00397F8D6A